MSKFIHWLRICWLKVKILANVTIKNSLIVREALAALHGLHYLLLFLPKRTRLTSLATALQLTTSPVSGFIIKHWLLNGNVPRSEAWLTQQIGWERYSKKMSKGLLTKSLILKKPVGEHEKGVIYVSYEYNFINLLQNCNWEKLIQDYFVVVASSWSLCSYNDLLTMAAVSKRAPIFFGISHDNDLERYAVFKPPLEFIPLLASDWIYSEFYRPIKPSLRTIDIVMVAGWTKWKNHWILFKALSTLPKSLRVLLIGQDMDGRTASDVLNEAKTFGVENQIEILCDVEPERVAECLCNSRCSLILSRREGSSVIVTESLFADTPVIMLEDAHVGSIKYVNAKTGKLTNINDLAATISDVLEHPQQFSPRAWISSHTGAEISTQQLNTVLQDYSKAHGLLWTQDIKSMCWRPDPIYLHQVDNDLMQSAYDDAYLHYALQIDHHRPNVHTDKG